MDVVKGEEGQFGLSAAYARAPVTRHYFGLDPDRALPVCLSAFLASGERHLIRAFGYPTICAIPLFLSTMIPLSESLRVLLPHPSGTLPADSQTTLA
jgi:hypothetical protein